MKINNLLATASLAFAVLASVAHAQAPSATPSASVAEVVVSGECVAETFQVPVEGAQVSYRLAGPSPVLMSSSCRSLQQADMPKEKLPVDNCTAPEYDFSQQDKIIRDGDPVKDETLVLTPQLSGCYVSAKSGIHTIFLPRKGMAGFVLSIRVVISTPYGSITGKNYNRLFHEAQKDIKLDPMEKVPICTPVPNQPNQCQ